MSELLGCVGTSARTVDHVDEANLPNMKIDSPVLRHLRALLRRSLPLYRQFDNTEETHARHTGSLPAKRQKGQLFLQVAVHRLPALATRLKPLGTSPFAVLLLLCKLAGKWEIFLFPSPSRRYAKLLAPPVRCCDDFEPKVMLWFPSELHTHTHAHVSTDNPAFLSSERYPF